MRRFPAIDFAAYFKAVGLLVRNPVIILAPLAAAMCNAALGTLVPNTGGTLASITGGIWGIIFFLINSFGLGVAIIAADSAWKRGKVSFDDAFDEGKRKVGDILMAAIGLNFIIAAAAIVGGIVHPIVSLVLMALALYFFVYTLPAAAIGGVPGGAALSISIDRVKSNYFAAALVLVAGLVFYAGIWYFATPLLLGLAGTLPSVVEKFASAIVLSIGSSYIALILAKTYADVTFTPPRW